jgi:hypothetical protein
MSAILADIFPSNATDPSTARLSTAPTSLFSDKECDAITEFVRLRECPQFGFPPSCELNLSFGFFFDGTNNNLKLHRPLHTHSNIARLYNAFPGGKDQHDSEAWPDLDTKYHKSFFRTYVPGVGTPFPEVGDSGKGYSLREDRPKGLAFCYLGENRIIWALVEAMNNVHRYYTNELLIDEDEFKNTFNRLRLPGFGDTTDRFYSRNDWDANQQKPLERLEAAFSGALQRLHSSLKAYLPVGTGKSTDKGKVVHIYTSMFGFSRGATKARAFANWFIWLCRLDAKLSDSMGPNLSLGTIPVTIDFMGLFDTVASVGIAASVPMFDGHQAWADTEVSLRIPPEPRQVLHLVSAHEIRRSFPLDSVSVKGKLPENCTEIVFPGVHSDVGGGYEPYEQGRGKDPEGADLISRVTLAVMYHAARLAGVPLKLEEAPDPVKRSFKIDPGVIQTLNAYIQTCREDWKVKPGEPVSKPLHELMEQQHRYYILWRKKMLGHMAELTSVQASDKHDKTDMLEADKELVEELGYFQHWNRNRYHGEIEQRPSVPEWIEIDQFWDAPAPPSSITDLFDQFVHDSRAWFKPLGSDVRELQYQMEMLRQQNDSARDWDATHPYSNEKNPYELTPKQRSKLDNYALYKELQEPRKGLDPELKGREPMTLGGGFLRYRRIYMGSDSF